MAPPAPRATGFWIFIRPEWWRAFVPARTRIDSRERLRILAGTLIGVFLTGLLCHLMGGVVPDRLPWLIAPMGASVAS